MDRLKRKPDETDLAYHKRLIYGKLVDGTLADKDFAELSPYVYGREYNTHVARRMMYGSRRTLELLNNEAEKAITSDDILSELDLKKIELKKEQQKLFDQRVALNRIMRERSRQEELNDIITKAVSGGNLPALPRSLPRSSECVQASDNDILVSLNDIHYGANISNHWNVYNSDVCRMMMSRYLDRIIEIGKFHGSENCIVWENGDAISGNIHRSIAVTNKENVIEQIVGVSELISAFLVELSNHFSTVKFVSVSGNHSRIDLKDRALKDERLDDLVEWYLAARLQNYTNIQIGAVEKIDSTMFLIDVRGKTYCGVHEDYDGSPAKIHALQAMATRPLYCVLSGHLHHNRVDEIQGVKTVMAGSFLGMDDFCISKRVYGKPEQLICICDETGIRCFYNIDL